MLNSLLPAYSTHAVYLVQNFANESYENKFQRIKAELDELESSIKVEATAKVSTNDVSELINRLSNLQGSLLLGGDAAVPPEDVSIDVPSKNGSSMLQYELFCKPSLEEAKLMSKLNIIDQRINKIENLIGKRGSLFDDSIVSVVSQLRAKVAQLDQASLDKLIARLNVVLEKVKRISETKSALEVIEKESKLNELYEHYVRTNESREVLLNTFERLQVLSSVQEQGENTSMLIVPSNYLSPHTASLFSTDLAGLKSAQDEVQLSIDRNSKTLKGLQEDFRTKTEEIKHTIEDFHKRLEKLSK